MLFHLFNSQLLLNQHDCSVGMLFEHHSFINENTVSFKIIENLSCIVYFPLCEANAFFRLFTKYFKMLIDKDMMFLGLRKMEHSRVLIGDKNLQKLLDRRP